MSIVNSLAVYILFFAILYKICKGAESEKFYSLVLGTLLFPLVGTFTSSPAISPNHAFIYTYLVVELLISIGKHNSIPKKIIILPLIPLLYSTSATILHTDGFDGKTFYVALRDFLETYGYFIAAYIAGYKLPKDDIFKKFFTPTIVLCICAFIEVLVMYNVPYVIICSAYPNYDMAYTTLESGGIFTDSWRIRAAVTTVHPTALGTLLSCLFAFYLPLWGKNVISNKNLLVLHLFILAAIVVCGSRTALICAGLTLILFIFFRVNIYLKFIFIGFAFFSLGSIFSLFVDQFENSRGSNLELRKEQMAFSVLSIRRSPIYGNGVQYTSKFIFRDTDDGSRGTAKGYYNENLGGLESIVFRKIIDFGILGLASFLFFLLFFQFYFLFNKKYSVYASSGGLVTCSFTLFLILSGTLANSIIYGFVFMGYCLANTYKAKIEAKAESPKEISCENQE